MDTTCPERIHLDRSVLDATSSVALGASGEQLAAGHLARDHGLQIVARNWRLAAGELRGELDIVAFERATGTLVVCEVKTRRDADRFGGATEALAPRQRQRLRALTGAFLREARLGYPQVRLDLIAIDISERVTLAHLEGAL